MKSQILKSIVAIFILGTILPLSLQARIIRVLAIGNSFSQDAVEQNLYELAHAQGDTLIIGNAYIGGCSIDRHFSNTKTGKEDYAYRKIVDGKKTNTKNIDIKTIIKDEPWDIISLQQQSGNSGLPSSYANLKKLKKYVEKTATNRKVEIIWHATWAYANNFERDSFKPYNFSQFNMLYDICKTIAREVKKVKIKRYVPNNLTIQYAREKMGDVLNRDGYHLAYTTGRYAAACTWCEFITGKSVEGNPYHPETITAEEALTLQQSAHRAMQQTNGIITKIK